MALHPQDLLVLYKQISNPEQASSIAGLAKALGMSLSQVHRSVERCVEAGLASRSDHGRFKPNLTALYEFAVHGVRYAFAAQLGSRQRGIPTAHGVPPISEEILSAEADIPVWPHPQGTHRGPSIEPLGKYAAEAALADSGLYQMLALQDTLRVGRSRERALAEKHLRQRMGLTHGAE